MENETHVATDNDNNIVEQQQQQQQQDDQQHQQSMTEPSKAQKGSLAGAFDPSKGIKTPAPTDVICGRGKMTVAHPGNRRFRELVMEKKEAYQKARRRDDKTKITFELVQKLRSGPEGGRFLLYDQNTQLWYDVGDEYAREKVSHSLRSRPNEQRRNKPKPRKKTVRKTQHSPALDELVQRLIVDQQALLKSMIETATRRAATEVGPGSGGTGSI